MKAALGAEIIRQIRPHWSPPSGADSDKLRTRVVVTLGRDGALAGEPRVTQTGVTASNRAQAELARERAIRAVKLAAPFKLPAQFYDAWKTIGPTLYEGL
ncbi:TonB C-terminal domain-containing protein [Sphingomonas sp. M1-B02]|uniref:TonB C-terminal domain-containing protein n=1 Tax=Sphingomonas sp. M1-B02 TaxID=3114300 RepID=UPI002AD2E5A0|nr:TonB C-terminal domain-containing protein [Sphingomonas sp. S6-11]